MHDRDKYIKYVITMVSDTIQIQNLMTIIMLNQIISCSKEEIIWKDYTERKYIEEVINWP